jgi:hypothetical protein
MDQTDNPLSRDFVNTTDSNYYKLFHDIYSEFLLNV